MKAINYCEENLKNKNCLKILKNANKNAKDPTSMSIINLM